MALVAASKTFRASTVCAGALPANRRISPARMHGFRIGVPYFQTINGRLKNRVPVQTYRMRTLIHPSTLSPHQIVFRGAGVSPTFLEMWRAQNRRRDAGATTQSGIIFGLFTERRP